MKTTEVVVQNMGFQLVVAWLQLRKKPCRGGCGGPGASRDCPTQSHILIHSYTRVHTQRVRPSMYFLPGGPPSFNPIMPFGLLPIEVVHMSALPNKEVDM